MVSMLAKTEVCKCCEDTVIYRERDTMATKSPSLKS